MTTSEFLDVKDRLASLTRPGKEKSDDPDRPRLRRTSSGGTVPIGDDNSNPGTDVGDEDERPTLKRR